jgi:hypothetical protein
MYTLKNKIMRKVIAVLVTFFSVFVFSQTLLEPGDRQDLQNNRFEQKQTALAEESTKAANRGGNPADPVPIDDFLPFLLVAAVSMIWRYGLRREYKF